MKLPVMQYTGQIRKTTQMHFRGLDHNLGARDGALWDMSNLTSSNYPLLSTRHHRHLYKVINRPGGIFAWEKMCYVDGDKFYYDGIEKGSVSLGLKTFGSLGAKIIILPDKKYYDVKTDKFGSLESSWSGTSLTFTNGTYAGTAAKANTIQATGVKWDDFFKVGDAVKITGCTKHTENNKEIIIREIDGEKLGFYEFSFKLDPEDKEYTETGSLDISRSVPDLIAICENNNRLWGCSKDTIYASVPGDPTNWNVFDGLDTDAWQLTPSSVGYFVGCAAYHGAPIFFKEDSIIKIYGSVPSDFRSMATASLGCQETSGKSMAIAGETMYYMGRTGMMSYQGGIPTNIARPFGDEKYTGAVAGSDGMKYYVSCKGEDGKYRVFVYDPERRSWHKEDYMQFTHFANWDGNLYGLTIDGMIWIMGDGKEMPEGVTREETFPWFAEFMDFTDYDANRKGVNKLQFRLSLDDGAYCKVLIKYDGGDWEVAKCLEGEGKKKNYNVPVTPRRCDNYRVRLEGRGDCQIYSFARDLYKGSSRG